MLATFRSKGWCVAFVFYGFSPAHACDGLVERLLTRPVQQALADMGCGGLAAGGLDRSDHKVDTICYESTAEGSTLTLVASLTCATSPEALFPSSVSDKITATVKVTSDCQLVDASVVAAGSFGQALIDAFDVNGKAREVLQSQLNTACSP